jgi:hypothetical protein
MHKRISLRRQAVGPVQRSIIPEYYRVINYQRRKIASRMPQAAPMAFAAHQPSTGVARPRSFPQPATNCA